MIRKHGLHLAFALLLGLALPPWSAADESGPASVGSASPAAGQSGDAVVEAASPDATACAKVVGGFHAALIDVMQNAESLGYQGRFDRLYPVVGETFEVEFMASKSVGRHWKSMGAEERQAWIDLFRRHLTANYASRFTGHSGETFATLSEEPAARDTILVRTFLNRPNGENVEFNYRMLDGEVGWRVIDIYLKGTVSELALRRSEFSSMIKREGFDNLVISLEDKISSWRKEAEASS
ncbi:MAG: ABC transporter substrate-binding protein [Deltaproteobacteria bacterium]|nr:ABC transporter substrate-binding protein [Deltaproteobacteria bacterium]MBW2418307.1 ABC transporter substrate-binding protein [Deltaproteobacteria bacterium]